jgi:hypothetical protein
VGRRTTTRYASNATAARVEGDRATIDRDLDRAEEPDRDAGEVGMHAATIPDDDRSP